MLVNIKDIQRKMRERNFRVTLFTVKQNLTVFQ